MKYPRKDHAVPLRLGGILTFALCVMRMHATPLRERFSNDLGIGGKGFGFPDGHIDGFGNIRFNPTHAPVIII